MNVPIGSRSRASTGGSPDFSRLASYGRAPVKTRRRIPVLPILLVLLVLGAAAGGFVLGRVTADQPAADTTAAGSASTLDSTAPTTTVPPGPVTAAVIHEIKPGENLQKIADLYGVTQAALIAFNDIKDPNRILWGMRLRIPPASWQPPGASSTVPGASTSAPPAGSSVPDTGTAADGPTTTSATRGG